VVIIDSDGSRDYSGGDSKTTNNRMELTAAIEALRLLPDGTPVLLRSDSQYLVNTINLRWKRNANADLWKQLDEEMSRRKVRFEWVRGHAGDVLNDRADRLALEAAKAAADAGRVPSRGEQVQLNLRQTRAAASGARQGSVPASTSADEATLKTLRPLLKEGEGVRRCLHCGGTFVAPERYKDSYCALIGCQLERRTRPAS
jgi:ribonuclease HI